MIFFLSIVLIHIVLIRSARRSPKPLIPVVQPQKMLRALICYLGILLAQALIIQTILRLAYQPAAFSPPASLELLTRYTLGGKITLLLISAYEEEVLFRAALWHLFHRYSKRHTPFIACSALLFALYHLQCIPLIGAQSCGIVTVIHAAAAGIWLALFHARYQRIIATIALHILYNGILLTAQALIL